MLGLLVGNALGAPIVENEVAVEAHAPNLNQQGRELFALYNLGSKVSKLKSRAASKEITSVQLMMSALGDQNAAKTPIKAVEMLALNDDLNTVVKSDNMCTRRAAMARAAGLAAGLALSQVSAPGFAAETKMVKMGSDTGNLVFIPDEIKICKGDSVTWYVEEPRETGTPRATPRALPLSPHCRGLSTAGSSTRPAPTTSSSTRRPSRRA